MDSERREKIADEREQVADEREQVADEREIAGDERELAGDEREQAGDEREQAGDERDQAADERDQAGEQRDQAADERDQAADERDGAADHRDAAGDQRDRAGDQRDQAAERRDRAAEQTEAQSGEIPTDHLNRSALARLDAASDRMRASQDRSAGATERNQAELDRNSAMADRGAAARERESSSIDELTGVYLRRAGFVELEREMARVKRAQEPLVLAFVDVNGLKVINDSHGHAAGDQLLVGVASAFKAKLRSHDLIIRYGGDEFVCAISGLSIDKAKQRLALVDEALAETTEHGSVTVGLAELEPDDTPEALVARADAALYRRRLDDRGDNSGP